MLIMMAKVRGPMLSNYIHLLRETFQSTGEVCKQPELLVEERHQVCQRRKKRSGALRTKERSQEQLEAVCMHMRAFSTCMSVPVEYNLSCVHMCDIMRLFSKSILRVPCFFRKS